MIRYDSSVDDVTAFVLTGGRSSRMGSDKALLSWAGETLLERTVGIAHQACGQVFICGSRKRYGQFGEVIEDAELGRGPLSGIQAALHATQTDLNLILSVDLPLMTVEFLAWLLQQARSGEQSITAPESQRQLQPLCAVYRRGFGLVAEESLLEDKNKVDALFASVKTRIIEEEELAAQGFSAEMFQNLNTPEEWKHAMVEIAKTKAKT